MRSRIFTSLSLSLVVLVFSVASVSAAPVVSIEAGLFSTFVAPDVVSNTPGSITFGADNPNTSEIEAPTETIAADATIVQPSNAPFGDQGFAPTCLEVTRDGGMITKLAFAASCTVSGSVTFFEDVFGPDADAYIVGQGRIFVPAADVDTNPQLATLIKTTADSGGTVNITFTIDINSGFPLSFAANTQIAGAVTMLGNGDVAVGAATLPKVVIDAAALAKLQKAAERQLVAAVDINGTNLIDLTGGSQPVIISLSVTLGAPIPTPPAKPVPGAPSNWDGHSDLDCDDFATQADAQAFYEYQGGPNQDPHRLDANNNGVACERNSGDSTPNTPVAQTITTNRAQVNPGGSVLVTGEGFKPFSTVNVYIRSKPVLLATVIADENGSFSISIRIPANLHAGSHTIEALGVDQNGASLSMRQGLILVAAETSMPDTAMESADSGVLSVLGLLLAVIGIRLGFARRLAVVPTRS